MKNLLLVAMFALAFVACSDDDDLSVNDVIGKWSIYEFEENGNTEPADLDVELSYFEFKSGGVCENYDFDWNYILKGTYVMEGDVITVKEGIETYTVRVLEMRKDRAVVEMEEEGKTFRAKVQRTDIGPQMFLEPVLEFGITVEQLKAKERRELYSEKSDELIYRGSNHIENNVGYQLKDGKVVSATLLFERDRTNYEELVEYLESKYKYEGSDGEYFVYSKGDNIEISMQYTAIGIVIIFLQK